MTGSTSPIARVFGSEESAMLDRLRRLDLVTFVLLVHAGVLLLAREVAQPRWVAGVTGAFGVFRVALETARRRTDSPGRRGRLLVVKESGSLVLAAALMVADGGTESPFFFWLLIILASYALVSRTPHLEAVSVTALLGYVGVMAAVSDGTATSIGRLGLLVAFGVVLQLGRLRLEHHQEAALRADDVIQQALDVAPVGIALVPRDSGHIVYANSVARDLEVVDHAGQARLTPVMRDLVDQVFRTGVEAGPVTVTANGNGRSRALRVVITPHGPAGTEAAVVCVQDVTEEKTADRERSRFLMFASHHLRTPLTPILGYAEMLRDGELSPTEQWRAIAEITAAGRELERLFERMAAVVRLQAESPIDGAPSAVSDVIDQMKALDEELLEGVTVLEDARKQIWCRADWAAISLRELVENGHRFGKPPVTMSWREDADCLRLEVHDAGPGPDPTLRDTDLFGHWGELSATTPSASGTQLGLYQARLLAELAGGSLRLDRDPDGWRFVLTLPTSGPVTAAISAD